MFKDTTNTFRYSKTRSTNMLPKKKNKVPLLFRFESSAKNKTKSPTKPTYVKKRSVSLPTDLSPQTIKTPKLFWFIPKNDRQCRRSYRREQSRPERIQPLSTTMESTEHFVTISPLLRSPEISERVALEWIATSSTVSLSDTSEDSCCDDDDDLDEHLFGLEFIDSVR